jgi:hypothetical protein
MRKYFSERFQLNAVIATLLFAFLSGCEKNFDEIIDVETADYQVTGTSSFSSFLYVEGDSSITIFLILKSSADVNSIFCDVIASDDTKLNNNPVLLLDNGNNANGDQVAGDNRFTNFFSLSRQNPFGTYRINYFVTDNRDVTKLAAKQEFVYDNGQDNVAPVISNAIIEPDTLIVNNTVPISTSIKVTDENGLNDIENVYFTVYRPDGTTSGTQTEMFDDGNLNENGDQTASDGIFSRIIVVDQTNAKGTYRFNFQARDRRGLLSNTIDYFVLIQ